MTECANDTMTRAKHPNCRRLSRPIIGIKVPENGKVTSWESIRCLLLCSGKDGRRQKDRSNSPRNGVPGLPGDRHLATTSFFAPVVARVLRTTGEDEFSRALRPTQTGLCHNLSSRYGVERVGRRKLSRIGRRFSQEMSHRICILRQGRRDMVFPIL